MNLDPVPSNVELVKENPMADNIWKRWFTLLREWISSPQGFKAPELTTAERDALDAEGGMIIYNITTNVFNFYENGSWVTK